MKLNGCPFRRRNVSSSVKTSVDIRRTILVRAIRFGRGDRRSRRGLPCQGELAGNTFDLSLMPHFSAIYVSRRERNKTL